MSGFRLSKRVSVALLSLALLALSLSSVALPVRAWSPGTHFQTGNDAISEILAGSNMVTIDGRQYPVDSRVGNAIRSFPEFYRGGVIGPDGFPDIYVGQEFIHVDNVCNMGRDTTCPGFAAPAATNACQANQCVGTFSYKWLKHVFDSGWNFYNSHNGDDEGKKALAFAYGYLTHAAGDMWGHTLINEFATGVFEDGLTQAINHIIVESYVHIHTPDTNLTMNAPSDFIFQTFIDDSFADSDGQTAKTLGRGVIFDYFFDLRARLVRESADLQAAADACSPLDFTCSRIVDLAKKAYVDAWIPDIDDGLHAWPELSKDIANALFSESPPSFDDALKAAEHFVTDHLLSMLGAPDFVGAAIGAIIDFTDWLSGLLTPVLNLIQPLKDAISQFENWVVKMTTGIDIQALKEFVKHPYNFINGGDLTIGQTTIHVGLPSDTSTKLDRLMCITDGVHNLTATFDPDCFAADHDTVVMAKLLLLNSGSLNQLLADHGVGPHYTSSGSDEGNAMLGYLRAFDGSQAWRENATDPYDHGIRYGEGTMPLWQDCQARINVFRKIFIDWPKPWTASTGNPNFPDEGDPCVVVHKFFTNGVTPLALDFSGNPKVDVVLANGRVRSTNPGQVVVWVNITNAGTVPLGSLRLNESLPVDWTVNPAWIPGVGSIHAFFVFSNGTRLEITNTTTITVKTGNPQTVSLSITNVTSTLAQKPLELGESILLSVRLSYGLVGTTQSVLSYPRTYPDTTTVVAWTNASYAGVKGQAKTGAFFLAVAKVVGT